MYILLSILFFISFVLLLWGVISPASLSQKIKKPFTRKDFAKKFGIATFVLLIFASVAAPPEDKNLTVENANTTKNEVLNENVKKEPVITTETVTETEAIPFQKTTQNSASMLQGTSSITTAGVNGVKTYTYEITYSDGKQTDKRLVAEETTTEPVNEITSVGTKAPPKPKPQASSSSCDPNYAGACVPIASDVDCAGGSGNGPAYVRGPVRVVGVDIYDLDRDGNGIGCE